MPQPLMLKKLKLNSSMKTYRTFQLHLENHISIQFNFCFFSITAWAIDLDYCDIEWFALETKRDHFVVFQIASKYCISESFVDYDDYSISSKGFLPTVVYIMVIGIKSAHSHPF